MAIGVRRLASHKPWLAFLLPLVLLRGRPALKRFVAGHAPLDPSSLPWRESVVEFARGEKTRGRRVVLATAADRLVAEQVASHLGVFDQVVATDLGANLKGVEKVAAIHNRLNTKEFDYVGDSRSDLPVFATARKSYLVAPSDDLRRAAAEVGRVEAEFR